MQCINPLILISTTNAAAATSTLSNGVHEQQQQPQQQEEQQFPNLNTPYKFEEMKKMFTTSQYTWNDHQVKNNCNCHKQHVYTDAPCNVNICPSQMLLQGSDDPLIGHGANSVLDDDHPIELQTLQLHQRRQQQQHQQQQQQLDKATTTTTSTVTVTPTTTTNWSIIVKEKLKNKASLMSAQAKVQAQNLATQLQLKQQQDQQQLQLQIRQDELSKILPIEMNKPKKLNLRFHQQQYDKQEMHKIPNENNVRTKCNNNVDKKERSRKQQQQQPPPPPQQQQQQQTRMSSSTTRPVNENVRSWLKSIVELQNNASKHHQQQQQQSISANVTHDNCIANKGMTTNDVDIGIGIDQRRDGKTLLKNVERKNSINFNDLPYMGEITLDNSRPRRGRKPKKANICHLIYKNYGTIIMGEPKLTITTTTTTATTASSTTTTTTTVGAGAASTTIAKCAVCMSNKRCICEKSVSKLNSSWKLDTNEATRMELVPLNLCLRDQYVNHEVPATTTAQIIPTFPIQYPSQFVQANKIAAEEKCENIQLLKNKRSTIFIPPKPHENLLNPSVEVSIGKFKFTGGVNPLLQKKKMLSVDSVGNYIYFDGNGNKTLHVSDKLQKQPSTCLKHTNNVLASTSFPKSLPNLNEDVPVTLPLHLPTEFKVNEIVTQQIPTNERLHSVRKRKITRRSEQRERLEKSFKEQGFLIQTQQMQSSEGATYCKFRQLKKFTRYLFRNWKAYLPNELQQQQQQEQRANPSVVQRRENNVATILEQPDTNNNIDYNQLKSMDIKIEDNHVLFKVEPTESMP